VNAASISFTRRKFVATVDAVVGSALASASAQDRATAAGKGTPVWLDMDQAELDAAYDQLVYAPNARQVLARYAVNSELARRRLGPPLRLSYGASATEAVDIYRPKTRTSNAPINVFLHGGSWRFGHAADYSFAAELFARSGVILIVPDFIAVQDAAGELQTMADQVLRAIAWVYGSARDLGGDPDRIFICGHSSGAHLAAVALTTDWKREFGLPANLLKGGVCCSGIYDLKPVRLSARSNYVRFTDVSEQELSPQRHLDQLNASLIVAFGTLESPEFQRQARDFVSAARLAAKPVELLVGEGYNHFEVIETLANPYGLLGRAILAQMNVNRLEAVKD